MDVYKRQEKKQNKLGHFKPSDASIPESIIDSHVFGSLRCRRFTWSAEIDQLHCMGLVHEGGPKASLGYGREKIQSQSNLCLCSPASPAHV